MRRDASRRGHSLTELVVVIALIALMLGMMAPALVETYRAVIRMFGSSY